MADTKEFAQRHGLSYSLGRPTREFKEAYRTPFFHFYLLIDREGVVRTVLSAHDPTSLPQLEKEIPARLASSKGLFFPQPGPLLLAVTR